MFRIYDKHNQCWVEDDICITPNEDIFIVKKGIFNNVKLHRGSDERYIYHKDIGLHDKNGILIYEGDIVESKDNEGKTFTALVSYALEFSAYIILDYESLKYYSLGNEASEFIQVIGNIFENPDLLPIPEENAL